MSGTIDFYCERFVCICTRCCSYGAQSAKVSMIHKWNGIVEKTFTHVMRDDICHKCGAKLTTDSWKHVHKYGPTVSNRISDTNKSRLIKRGHAYLDKIQQLLSKTTGAVSCERTYKWPNKTRREQVSNLGVAPNVNLFAKL